MDVINQCILRKKIKFCLVFFCILSFNSCIKKAVLERIKVNYKDENAVSISIVSNTAIDTYTVFIKGNNTTPVLGTFNHVGDILVFTPVVPFSKGQHYVLKKRSGEMIDFKIDLTITAPPQILAMYPSADTIPENLLKLYLVFSKPMQEVQPALNFIEVHNITDNEPSELFLTLENELWNAKHTELTLWLDPGRIKTNLILNRTKGLPIVAGKTYRIRILEQWKDAEGGTLVENYTKIYHVAARDSKKPSAEEWKFQLPKKGTRDALFIDFKEPLDAMLVLEALQFSNADDALIKGNVKHLKEENLLAFYPEKPWIGGVYKLIIASRLEDLAGNNLNHLFDRDLKMSRREVKKDFITREFQIK